MAMIWLRNRDILHCRSTTQFLSLRVVPADLRGGDNRGRMLGTIPSPRIFIVCYSIGKYFDKMIDVGKT